MHSRREGNDLPFEPGPHRMSGDVFRIGKGIVQPKGESLEDCPLEVKGIQVRIS
jgi:hypothetical protein